MKKLTDIEWNFLSGAVAILVGGVAIYLVYLLISFVISFLVENLWAIVSVLVGILVVLAIIGFYISKKA